MAEKITFSSERLYKDLHPLDWLQYMADEFSSLAELWDEYDPNHFEEEFESYKEEYPKSTKIEMYSEVSNGIGERLLHSYIHDSGDIIQDIEHLRENVLKAFEGSVIFPNLLSAIGIIEYVITEAKDIEDSFYYSLHYIPFLPTKPTPEDINRIIEDFGPFSSTAANKLKNKLKEEQGRILTVKDYEKAFDCITVLLENIEKKQFSQKLRESAWAIKGYCKLEVGSEKYAEIEEQIKKQRKSKAEKIASIAAHLNAQPYAKSKDIEEATGIHESDVRRLWTPIKRAMRKGKKYKPAGSKNKGKIEAEDKSASCRICSAPLSETFHCDLCKERIIGECKTCHYTNTHPNDAIP